MHFVQLHHPPPYATMMVVGDGCFTTMSKPPDFYKSEIARWGEEQVHEHLKFRLGLTYLTSIGLDMWLTNYVVRTKINEVNRILDKMSKGKKSQQNSQAEWGGYVNIRLTEAQLKEYDAYLMKHKVQAETSLAFLLNQGKVSIQYTNDSFTCTLTAEHAGKIWALSAFSADWVDAVNLLAYKVTQNPDWYKTGGVNTRPLRG